MEDTFSVVIIAWSRTVMKPFGPWPDGVGCANACSVEPAISRQLEQQIESANEGLADYEHNPKADGQDL